MIKDHKKIQKYIKIKTSYKIDELLLKTLLLLSTPGSRWPAPTTQKN